MKLNEDKRDILFIGINILIITFLHYFTVSTHWGIHDFYRRLYYIPIIVAAFRFRLKGGLITSIIVSSVYAPHIFIYFNDIDIAILNQILEIFMFLIVGVITGYLVESDFKKKVMLELQIKKLIGLENYTRNILDSITNVVIAVDNDLNIKSVNKEGKNLFYSDNKNEKLNEIFTDYKEVNEKLKDVIKYNKKYLSIETQCKSEWGEILYVKLLAYPLRNIAGDIEGLVIVLEDISEIRKLENQIRRAEKLSAVGELASGVAHEIRNPLGIIKTISQTLYSEVKDEDMKEGLGIISQEIDRANLVIQGLLNFAKPGMKEVKLFNIKELIKEVVLIIRKYAEQHNVRLNLESQINPQVLIDKDNLKQSFINIIFNAIQAMPKGGKLDIEVTIDKGWVKTTFYDTGVGIPEKKLEKIFEPFYTTKDTGTGLGLSITHRIIEEHKGYIEVESELNKGTIVHIYLPLKG
ncbi:PAS domain S-box protein [Clostridium sp. D2Q-11]|uniref:histidine kinase n=1 Tax=Anaeromonas frigoriresistens TaxID=2683708 RepID=A0A942UWS3_9FIRM|nr:ATP-binding protein [Anaeromonas frigoriresistens]MBS4538249.1 PAS domain S-box protein [Anaeromonas frigoriresistens]